jgi:hypothetical protein
MGSPIRTLIVVMNVLYSKCSKRWPNCRIFLNKKQEASRIKTFFKKRRDSSSRWRSGAHKIFLHAQNFISNLKWLSFQAFPWGKADQRWQDPFGLRFQKSREMNLKGSGISTLKNNRILCARGEGESDCCLCMLAGFAI